MIKSISVKPENLKEFFKLELANPYKTGLVVGSVTGLDPGQATVNTVDLASSDGAYYSNARYSSRNIVLAILVLNDWPTNARDRTIGLTTYKNAIEYNRHTLYKLFPVKRKIRLQIETDVRSYEIEGYVESNSVGIFSYSQSAQVSIICPYPYFHDISTNVNVGTVSARADLLEFKGWNDTEGDVIGWSAGDGFPSFITPLHMEKKEFSRISSSSATTYQYLGDIDYGFEGKITVRGTTGDISISSENQTKVFKIDDSVVESITGSPISSGDSIEFSTINGSKHLYLSRNGVRYNILNSLAPGSSWLRLYPGENGFEVVAENGLNLVDLEIWSDIYYQGI